MIEDDSFKHYLTDIRDKDEEHRSILHFLRQAYVAVKEKNLTWAKDRLSRMLQEWAIHIDNEEKFMEHIGFPYIEAHKENHLKLSRSFAKVLESPVIYEYSLNEIRKMLYEHIDHFDLQYGVWYKKTKK